MTGDHLDDDALSATLDGEATSEEAAHVESCASCTARSAVLRAAAAAIGRPVPAPDPARRDAAIAAALRAQPTELAARRRRLPAWPLAAAAALLALVLLVPLALDGGDKDERTAAPSIRDEEAVTESSTDAASETMMADESAPTAAAAGAPAGLGELDGHDLRTLLEPQLTSSAYARAAPDTGSTTEADKAGAAAPPPAPCQPEVEASRNDLGPLVLSTEATQGGRPVWVLVFEQPGTEPRRVLAVVVPVDDCSTVLQTASFEAPS